MPLYAHPEDSYMNAVQNAQRPQGVRLGNLERETVPARVDALDVNLAIWTAEAMLEEA